MNATSTIPRNAPVGNMALEFNPVKKNYVSIPEGIWFDGDLTIEAWVFVLDFTNNCRILDFGNGENSDNVILSISDQYSGKPFFSIIESGQPAAVLISDTAIPQRKWVHVACTLKGSNAVIYINGTAHGVKDDMPAPKNINRTSNYIARSNFSSDSYTNALFSEIRIWNIPLTCDQINECMEMVFANKIGQMDWEGNVHTNIIGNWRCCEGYGNQLFNYSDPGNTTNGELKDSSNSDLIPEWSISARLKPFSTQYNIQMALRFFKELKDYILVPPKIWFNGDFSLETWVYLFDYIEDCRISEFTDLTGNKVVLTLSSGNTQKPSISITQGSTTTELVSEHPIPLNKWMFLACTLRDSTATFYINGVPTGQKTDMTAPMMVGTFKNFIARNSDDQNPGGYPEAIFNNFRIWQGTLTINQIIDNMYHYFPGAYEYKNPESTVTATLTGNFRMDEGSGTIAYNYADLGGQTNGMILCGTIPDKTADWVHKWFNYLSKMETTG